MIESPRGPLAWGRTCRALSVAVAGLLLTSPRPALADVAACAAAHAHGQAERNAGHLQNARADFISCSTSACPGAIRAECASFLAQVESNTSSVVFAALDENGHDVTDVKVIVDGEPVLEKLNGLAVTLDPGSHEVRYAWPDGFEQKQLVLVAQGEKNRRVELRREPKRAEAPPPPPVSAPAARRTPAAAYALVGLGVAALGSFAAFAVTGKAAERDMDGCKPYCAQSQADKMRFRYLLADISLGVGVVALSAGGYLFISASAEPSTSAWRGGSVGVRGAF